ncbi:hypothetical protein GCM10007890_20150 [Methylobacterium tardum]|uniref:Uncharacterized protein n=2 Tax=Methylobacteriaceae TaxID=119045 RepID=A0AA37WS82_9HYPH|nr:hypothetical protein GCM10007890_20150 [Methylobacterium tardum]
MHISLWRSNHRANEPLREACSKGDGDWKGCSSDLISLDSADLSDTPSLPAPTGEQGRMSEKPKTTDAEYLAQFSESPYGFRANKRVVVEGKSELKGSWRRAQASGETKAA